ncbi:hypothetical protein C8F01DRAFT_1369205, partial [Mycena amicta]
MACIKGKASFILTRNPTDKPQNLSTMSMSMWNLAARDAGDGLQGITQSCSSPAGTSECCTFLKGIMNGPPDGSGSLACLLGDSAAGQWPGCITSLGPGFEDTHGTCAPFTPSPGDTVVTTTCFAAVDDDTQFCCTQVNGTFVAPSGKVPGLCTTNNATAWDTCTGSLPGEEPSCDTHLVSPESKSSSSSPGTTATTGVLSSLTPKPSVVASATTATPTTTGTSTATGAGTAPKNG